MPTFVCLKDGTDLTSVVQDSLTSSSPVVLADNDDQPWTVLVTCPTDQCQNLFTSQMAANAGDGRVTGAIPDAQALALVDAANAIGPAKALAAAGDAAKFVLDRISLIALVVGGFGIFTDLGGGFSRHPWLFGAITVASALALLLAVVALFPRVGSIDTGNLLEVSSAYESAIKWRGRLAQIATAVLVAALVLALVAFFKAARDDNPAATLTASYDGTGTPSLSYNAELKALPKGAAAVVTLIALKKATTPTGSALATTVGDRDRAGDATIAGKVTLRRPFHAYRVVARIDWGTTKDGKRAHHLRETLTVTAPLPPVPKKKTPKANGPKASKSDVLPATTAAAAATSVAAAP